MGATEAEENINPFFEHCSTTMLKLPVCGSSLMTPKGGGYLSPATYINNGSQYSADYNGIIFHHAEQLPIAASVYLKALSS